MALDIKGMQKTDILNYEPYTTATLFLSRCNFSCPFCHNPDLIKNHKDIPTMPEEEVFKVLDERKQWYDGVCLTGGEPTLHAELPDFLKKLKERDLLVKLDTNGTNPEMLKIIIEEKLVDYLAMDIKAPFEKYDEVTKVKTDISKIKKSVELIKNSGLDYEFRTTVIPHFHSEEDLLKIAEQCKGAKRFVLQQFRNDVPMLDKDFGQREKYLDEELVEFSEKLKEFFDEVKVKNI
ncbi:MAG: anaerobic ribonucleoside-triphosphate reductase activating protein [Nanoarchaeota archaeon]|nr:anaerobic ribonucleoside-triphosphate reductase activating protein [Nanoarchaeota archaeon]